MLRLTRRDRSYCLLRYVDDTRFKFSGFANARKVPQASIDMGEGQRTSRSSGAFFSGPERRLPLPGGGRDSFVPDGKPGPEKVLVTYPLQIPPPVCVNEVFRVGLSAALPDCRAYEMVSPVDKNGGDIKVLLNIIYFPARLDESADDGNSFTYTAVPAFADPKSAPFASQYMARRGDAGWSSKSISPPRESVPLTDQYGALTLNTSSSPPISPTAGWPKTLTHRLTNVPRKVSSTSTVATTPMAPMKL